MSLYNVVHETVLIPTAMNKCWGKGCSQKGMDKIAEAIGSGRVSSDQWNRVVRKANLEGKKVHFATLTDLCHIKNFELEEKFRKYKGREVLRGDIVKDDSGNHAVFTEQGASASHMTAAKGLDVNSRLHGCSGQAGDAVSAYTQVDHNIGRLNWRSSCTVGAQSLRSPIGWTLHG